MRWRDTPATAVLTGATLIVSAALLLTGFVPAATVIAGFVPARLAGLDYAPGALPAWLTPLSATLVHGGPMHLLFNLVMLGFSGRMLERAIGGVSIVVLYVVGAYAATIAEWAIDPASTVPMIGASGAVSALVGAYALLYGESRARRIGPIPSHVVHVAWLAAAWIGMQVLIGLAGAGDTHIAIGAHIGGFIAGLALARPLLLWRYRDA